MHKKAIHIVVTLLVAMLLAGPLVFTTVQNAKADCTASAQSSTCTGG